MHLDFQPPTISSYKEQKGVVTYSTARNLLLFKMYETMLFAFHKFIPYPLDLFGKFKIIFEVFIFILIVLKSTKEQTNFRSIFARRIGDSHSEKCE